MKKILCITSILLRIFLSACTDATSIGIICATPFTDKDSVVEIFKDLSMWAGIRKVIENINMNAAA